MTSSVSSWTFWMVAAPCIAAAAAILTVMLIVWLRPLLVRYALARPNVRSSHREPTPQGGGAAVVAATLAIAGAALALSGTSGPDAAVLLAVFAATVLIAIVGAVDDIRTIEAGPRLLLQAFCVGLVLAAFQPGPILFPFLPWWLEFMLLLLGGLWFVNLVNFMDGLDLMTVSEAVPVAAGIVILGAFGAVPPYAILVSLALLGGLLGFVPFNRPVARLFLGDVGSLPIGLLLGWLLLVLAREGHLTAALLLPLYYLMDATITLCRRIAKGERIWQAHRTHFYQRATDRGLIVIDVVTRVFGTNVILVGFAVITATFDILWVKIVALCAGLALTGAVLVSFHKGRP